MRLASVPVRFFVLFSIILVAFSTGFASEPDRWHAFDGAAQQTDARVETVSATPGGIDLDVTVPGVLAREITTKAGPRGLLGIPGGGAGGELGTPRIPVLRYLVEVPPGASVDVQLSPAGVQSLSLATLGLTTPLVPVQPPVPKIAGAEELIPFEQNAAVYATDRLLPDRRAAVVDRAVLRGRHVALIEVRPVRYNPVQSTVEVFSSATLQVRFEGGHPEAAQRAKSRLSSHVMDSWLDDAITGAPETQTSSWSSGGAAEGAEGMLVIAYDAFVDALQPFLDWKSKTGFKVVLVRTSEIGASPTDADVKAVIQNAYDTWSEPSLGFVLMVGDTDFTPIHLGTGGSGSQVTDNWYACLDGTDYLPEVAIARISTRTAQETANVVDKLLTYERATFTQTDWAITAGFIATNDSGHIGLIEGTHDYCIDTYYTPNGFLPTPWSYGAASCDRHYNTTDADTSDIAASINAGRTIVNYSGHGGYTSWEGPTSHGSFDAADVRALTNDDLYPFVISNACITGTLDNTECFGETWQKEPNKGAIAFWGASNNSYWDEDDVLQRDTHDNMFPLETTPPIGVIINDTKIDLYDHYGPTSSVAYYFDMYNLLSEPSLLLWTRQPRAIDVTYPSAQPIGEANFTATVMYQGQPLANALVAVRKTDEGVFESGYTDASGVVTLVLDPAPSNVGPVEVTVTGRNMIPHEGTWEVISPDSPWLVHEAHTVDDSAGGDGDGHANPGEDLLVTVTVENVGGLPGAGLQGTLTTTTPQWCQVLDANATFPDLAPGEFGDSLPDHYLVRVADTAPDGAYLGFDLSWTATGGAAGTTSFNEPVLAIDFAYDGHGVSDFEFGNGNGVAGPGETVDLDVTLANIGQRNALGISAVLTTASPHITILQDQATFPDMNGGTTGQSQSPGYRFSVASDAPDQQSVTFDLAITETGSGHTEVVVFDVMISSCATTDAVDVPKSITDNSTVESLFDYPNPIEIGDINVFLDISHTYIGDLRISLVSPMGTTVVLHDRSGGSSNDILTWYDTETQPAEPLTAFNGENSYGQWRLIIEDLAGGDQGSLNAWSLEVCGEGISGMPEIGLVDRSLDDAGGGCHPDGVSDVGETVFYNLVLKNDGWGWASGVRAWLASDARVAVLNNPIELPDLAPGEQTTAPFEVFVGAVGCMEPVTFNLTVESNEGTWVDAFVDRVEMDVNPTTDLEDVEDGGAEPAGWTHAADLGADDWRVIGSRNHTAGGLWSWSSGDSATISDTRLESPPFAIVAPASMEFWHWVDLQSGYDGGVIEITDDDGATWTDLGPYITQGYYDRDLSGDNPIAGRDAWTGSYAEWRYASVDLSAWSGKTIRVSWRLTCNEGEIRKGWWIDDVTVYSNEELCDAFACGVPPEVLMTSMYKQSGDVVMEWLYDPLCVSFRVWRSADPTVAGGYVEVTGEDPDPTDIQFVDTSNDDVLFWIIQGTGPDGDGPWGHYSQ
jgi:subtilisin-like proprotein convertase family protein